MTDTNLYIVIATAGLAGLAMIVTAGLAGWRGWLQLKSREFDRAHDLPYPPAGSAASRIELADLKERIRKLEAIAAGVDL
ncbi:MULTISPECIES: hypothetical protein [Sphingomonas]|jgi:hypothetical protein|uniref:Uncharacterized protein n=1 Tax=Sphingomonas zeae TaxID=1646122 RepID=A0A7Y6B299_9SPHN|nr:MULTISPECIES: hypothetical protein [Sphingomonas]MBB4047513.1 hypothetical protein [Sphingomonas zeae]MDK8185128.1 hypothetical protein [Sphingomonas zeae]MDK8214928.1 hypothetical protein [Sphingomonas sp. UMB7805-LC452B]NUU46107.1 hypothetical protein [Sphingomonas zeae]